MGSVEPEKGSVAGALEVPPGLTQSLAQQASRSIGDTYLVASKLPAEEGAALIAAGKAAFRAAHVESLSAAAAVIAALAVAVYFLLAGYRPTGNPAH